jgi:polyisoprenoid-binding protein YceI
MLLAAIFAAALELHADPSHTSATFAVKHMMVTTVRGQFNKAASTLAWDKQDPTKSSVTLNIDVASVDTHAEKRDDDLRSPNFFDAQRCPEIIFKSSKVEKAGAGKYKVTGDLTMHCVTKPVTLDVAFDGKGVKAPWGPTIYAASAATRIKRSDWDLKWNKALEGGGVLVADDVDINVDLEYPVQAAEAKK